MTYILIVDDEQEHADLASEWLTEHGYEVSTAGSGIAGLASLVRRPADLVLLDVMMPEMTGLEVLRQMRAWGSLRTIPVIVMTSLQGLVPPDAAPLYEALVVKPYRVAELLRVIEQFVAREP